MKLFMSLFTVFSCESCPLIIMLSAALSLIYKHFAQHIGYLCIYWVSHSHAT